MLEITPEISIEESEVVMDYIRASGPGGQNVNKVATAVQLRFDIWNSPSLNQAVKERLVQIGGNRVHGDGILVIEASRYRSQEQNRQDAIRRLARFISMAAKEPKRRRKTKPSLQAKQRRLDEKRRRGEIKRLRQQNQDF